LSSAGAALLPAVRRLLAAADELPLLARAAAAGESGLLRLAFVSSIAYGPLPQWLRDFRSRWPQVRLELREATLDVQLDAFARDEIDAGFVLHAPGEPPAAPAALIAWRVMTEPLVLALPEGHALAVRRAITLRQLAGEPLVIFPRVIAPSLYDTIVAAYRSAGVDVVVAQQAIQMQTIVNLVSAGIGVAWVPQALMQLQRPGVVYRTLRGEALRCETSLVWRASAPPAVLRRFIDSVRTGAPGAAQQRQSRRPAVRP
jgi:DNA-binding transcriptional LysR family regulator